MPGPDNAVLLDTGEEHLAHQLVGDEGSVLGTAGVLPLSSRKGGESLLGQCHHSGLHQSSGGGAQAACSWKEVGLL